jgi:iron-sulfur cluster repair protein YtfE (RIC family)
MASSIPLTSISMPGHRAPAAGFEAPFDLLGACHERVERTLGLLARLQQHVRVRGWDDSVASAARDVMRYFDLAAPLHHQDEERHVFPPLLASEDAALQNLVQRLQQDHRQMETVWVAARAALAGVAQTPPPGWCQFSPREDATLTDFARLYHRHLQEEDGLVYPAAQVRLTSEALQSMSADMMRRRGLEPA